jgi:hypothetical protein
MGLDWMIAGEWRTAGATPLPGQPLKILFSEIVAENEMPPAR